MTRPAERGVAVAPGGRLRPLGPMLLPALAAFVARAATGPHTVDYAYITFRYARNLALGQGLVYNPGEWVLGSTAPLWALVLAAFHRLGATDLPWLATGLSALLDGATAGGLVLLAARLGCPPAAASLVGLAWAVNPPSIAYAVGGMETSLFVAAVVGALGLAAVGRTTQAAALAGAATFVRPEAALAALTVLGWDGYARRRVRLAPLLAAAGPAIVGAAALMAWYGTPVPQTILAKQVAYRVEAPWLSLVAFALQPGLPGWSTFLFAVLAPVAALPLALAGTTALLLLARAALRRRDALSLAWQPFAVFGGAYVLFHLAGGLRGARLFPWYLVPMIPLYLLVGAAAVAALGRTRAVALAGGLALVLWQLPAVDWHRPLLPAGFDLRREALYLEVGRRLADEYPPATTVAAPEIGALGYASGLRIVDTAGLVTPAASRYYPLAPEQVVGDNAIPPGLIVETAPDVVVTLDQFARRSLLADAAFLRDYRLERSYPARVWLSEELLVFRRAEGPGRAP